MHTLYFANATHVKSMSRGGGGLRSIYALSNLELGCEIAKLVHAAISFAATLITHIHIFGSGTMILAHIFFFFNGCSPYT